jgi:alkanesulfonate monooxygenase SsuD/methylene tetrahydromethanopterin reductase-like flavin-dependent oxidoreductase (luciferase family)
MRGMRLSYWLPTFTHGAPDYRRLAETARLVERRGYAGIYLLDHVLPITGVHQSAWLETVVGLGALAAATEAITIGSASMIVGFRHPVLLAKQLASVAVIAGSRLVLGASSGWYAPEYAAFGHSIQERGTLTDETLEATRLLLTEDNASYHGKHWSFGDITIAPRPSRPIPFVVGGGSRTAAAGSARDLPELAPSVLERILRWDGWLAPCSGDEALTYGDLDRVKAGIGRRPDRADFRLMHVQWIHVVDTDDRERALREQLPLFRALMGEQHTDQHFIETYLVGSRQDIRDRVARVRARGFHELIVGPVSHDPRQIDLVFETLAPVCRP